MTVRVTSLSLIVKSVMIMFFRLLRNLAVALTSISGYSIEVSTQYKDDRTAGRGRSWSKAWQCERKERHENRKRSWIMKKE